MKSICGAASIGRQGSVNQDCCYAREMPYAIAVADGLGSHRYSEVASRAAILAVADAASFPVPPPPEALLAAAAERVRQEAAVFCVANRLMLPPGEAFSTTLIVGIERSDAVEFAWLGNGAIIHLHGSALLLRSKAPLPWQMANLLVPHVERSADGKAALTRFLCGISSEDCEPSSVSITLDKANYGDVFIVCTDGVLSNEEQTVGKVGDGSLWRRIETGIIRIVEDLASLVRAPVPLTSDSLGTRLYETLNSLRDDGELQDDASLAVLVSGRFVAARAETGLID